MLTRRIRTKLTIFGLIASAMIAAMAAYYVQIPQLVGVNRYRVVADFADTSGLYPGANVTVRGVDVGKVRRIQLTPNGSAVHIDIDDNVQVPVDSEVRISSTSAVGEQYLDIVPRSARGPHLGEGDRIARSNTVQMPQAAPMLESANALLASVPKQDLTDLLTNVTTAFEGSGPDMERLLSQSSALVEKADQEFDSTEHMLRSSRSFLDTQQDLATSTAQSLESLAEFSGTVADSDDDLRSLIDHTTPAVREIRHLVEGIRESFPVLLDNTAIIGGVARTYLAAVEQILVFLPAIVSSSQKGMMVAPNGMTEVDFAINVGNPGPCLKGYLPPDQYQTMDSEKTVSTPAGLACTLPPTSQISVRGSRNLPCFEKKAVRSRAPSVEACLGKPPSNLPSTNFTQPHLPVLDEPKDDR